MAKILIIEDEQLLAEAYTFMLKSRGHTITCAANGLEGLEKAKSIKPDLILLDMMMPVLDGLGFLKHFNAKRNQHTKVILLSNLLQDSEQIDQAMDLGVYQYGFKASLAPPQLLELVKQALADK